jgi:hypothetical protein
MHKCVLLVDRVSDRHALLHPVQQPPCLLQVHQARLLMEQEAGRAGGGLHLAAAPEGLLEAAAALWGAAVRRVHISEFHADVAAQLRAMGTPCAPLLLWQMRLM